MPKSADRQKIRAIKIIAAIVGIAAVLSVGIYILFKNFFGDGTSGGLAFRDLVHDYPVIGALTMVAATVIQVVIAFIPGELLEQVSGYLFGTWGGAVLSLVGSTLGSVLVLLIVRKFGRKLVYAIYPQEKIEQISFLRHGKKRNILTAFVFFIPGTPKDLITYVIGLTDMSIPMYLLLTTPTRIPSIMMSTISGNWIADMLGGESVLKRILFLNGAAVVLAIVGYTVYTLINNSYRKKHPRPESDKREKSCGAVVYTKINGQIKYVVVKNPEGICGFPKGHVEAHESESETALREVLEETGLRVELIDGFRTEDSHIIPGTDITKDIVYFLGFYKDQKIKYQKEELSGFELLTYGEAMPMFKFESSKRILTEANDFLLNQN